MSDFSNIDTEEHSHPAFEAFKKYMEDKSYGWDPLNQAWAFFKAGWQAKLSTEEWVE